MSKSLAALDARNTGGGSPKGTHTLGVATEVLAELICGEVRVLKEGGGGSPTPLAVIAGEFVCA